MDEWIDRMAETLSVDRITPGEMGATREEAAKRAIEAALALIPPRPDGGATPAASPEG